MRASLLGLLFLLFGLATSVAADDAVQIPTFVDETTAALSLIHI